MNEKKIIIYCEFGFSEIMVHFLSDEPSIINNMEQLKGENKNCEESKDHC